jgi:hypothetical protein
VKLLGPFEVEVLRSALPSAQSRVVNRCQSGFVRDFSSWHFSVAVGLTDDVGSRA